MGTPEGRSITPEQLATRELGVQNREFTYAASRHGSRISEVEERKPRRRGVVRKTGDWLAWGFVATIGQAAKNVVETTLEAGVYAGTIYGAIFLAKLAAFAPAVAFLGSFFVPAAAFLMATTFFTIFNIAAIKSYDKLHIDALGYERIKRLRKYSFFRTIIDPIIFTALCVWDPLDATLYARKGSEEYNGMSGRDWRNLFLSTMISNAVWLSGIGVLLHSLALL